MIGRRVHATAEGLFLAEGDYARDASGAWSCMAPGGLVGNLRNHDVTEHEDGTITVSPSIKITGSNDDGSPATYHGFIEKGVWRNA